MLLIFMFLWVATVFMQKMDTMIGVLALRRTFNIIVLRRNLFIYLKITTNPISCQ